MQHISPATSSSRLGARTPPLGRPRQTYRYISVSSGHTVPISLSGTQVLTDPVATSKTEDLIESLAEDYTVVVTHSMQQAARISDRTAVFLTGGELVEYDDTETIFENPESQRVENYITGKFG